MTQLEIVYPRYEPYNWYYKEYLFHRDGIYIHVVHCTGERRVWRSIRKRRLLPLPEVEERNNNNKNYFWANNNSSGNWDNNGANSKLSWRWRRRRIFYNDNRSILNSQNNSDSQSNINKWCNNKSANWKPWIERLWGFRLRSTLWRPGKVMYYKPSFLGRPSLKT